VIEMLAGLVPAVHKVNLSKPNVVLLIEVFRNTFGFSVVTDFHKTRKFNVRSIIDPPVSTKPGEAKKAEEDATEDATVKEAEKPTEEPKGEEE
jgi:tRNA acetyltransferase TAN1